MQDSQTTRLTLLVRIRDHDQQAWAEFVEIYSPGVYAYLRRRGLQDADAADVTQDVFRTVARSVDRFQSVPRRGSFRAWLMTVVRSRLSDHFTARRRDVQGSGDSQVQCSLASQPAPTVQDELFEQEYRRSVFEWAVRRIRPQFRENTWQAFWRTGVEGQAVRAVAEALGISEGAVYIARCRVFSELRKHVAAAEGEGEML